MNIAVIFRGNLLPNERDKCKFNDVINSHKKLFQTHNVDFYMHLWSETPETEINIYEDFFLPQNIVLEKNSIYHKDILEIYNNIVNHNYDLKFVDILNELHGESQDLNKIRSLMFAQISSAISFKQAINIFNEKKTISYDYIFVSRPDLLFSNILDVPSVIDENIIYVDKHGPNIFSGDYCYLTSEKNCFLFLNMFSYLKDNLDKLIPIYHYWYYHYLHKICNKEIKWMGLDATDNITLLKYLDVHTETSKKIKNFLNNN